MDKTDTWVRDAWEKTVTKVGRTSRRIGPGFPHASVGGRYVLEPPHWWTAGFWPGLLWLIYRDTKQETLREIAEACENELDRVLYGFDTLDHDIGFMWTLTSVTRYKLSGDEKSRKRALLAAGLLASRFNVKGRYIRAWNPWRPGEDNAGWAIIDCLMNLSLLYWASAQTGDPRFRHVAMAHADTVLKEFYHPDGSVHHIVVFDPETGERVGAKGGQGFSEHSAWSRGNAWALYGMALSFKYTGEQRYLDASRRTADFFLEHLPEDQVPYWDFRLPPDALRVRDSSAGAIAASGLLLLARLVSPEERAAYREAAKRLLKSLYLHYGAWDRDDEEGLILQGTSHVPEGKYIEVPLIYGDYFFTEGIAQLLGYEELF